MSERLDLEGHIALVTGGTRKHVRRGPGTTSGARTCIPRSSARVALPHPRLLDNHVSTTVSVGGSRATFFASIRGGHLEVPPINTVPFENAAVAHELLQTRHAIGKILLVRD